MGAGREGLDYGIANYSETRRASGPFGVDYRNANRAGVFYAMFLPMFVALMLFLRSQRIWRIAAVVAVSIMAMAIMVTFSRPSFLIGTLGLCVLLLRRNVVVAVLVAVGIDRKNGGWGKRVEVRVGLGGGRDIK